MPARSPAWRRCPHHPCVSREVAGRCVAPARRAAAMYPARPTAAATTTTTKPTFARESGQESEQESELPSASPHGPLLNARIARARVLARNRPLRQPARPSELPTSLPPPSTQRKPPDPPPPVKLKSELQARPPEADAPSPSSIMNPLAIVSAAVEDDNERVKAVCAHMGSPGQQSAMQQLQRRQPADQCATTHCARAAEEQLRQARTLRDLGSRIATTEVNGATPIASCAERKRGSPGKAQLAPRLELHSPGRRVSKAWRIVRPSGCVNARYTL